MMSDRRGTSPLAEAPGGVHLPNPDLTGAAHKLSSFLNDSALTDLMAYGGDQYTGEVVSGNLTTGQYNTEAGYQAASPYITVQSLSYNSAERDLYQGGTFKAQSGLYSPGVQQNRLYEAPTMANNISSSNYSLYEKNGEKLSPPTHQNPSQIDAGFIQMLANTESFIKKEKLDYIDGAVGSMATNGRPPSYDLNYPGNNSLSTWCYFPTTDSSTTDGYLPPEPVSVPQGYNPAGYPSAQQQFFTHAQGNPSHLLPGSLPISQSNWAVSPSLHGLPGLPVGKQQASVLGRSIGPSKPKSRRKSSTENGVRSPNKSPQAVKTYPGLDKRNVDTSVLDSRERERLVTSLMSSLKTTVQFEAFCLSFPRRREKEYAFHQKVRTVANLTIGIEEKHVTSPPFPEKYIRSAETVINVFKTALSRSVGNVHVGALGSPKLGDFSEQVEEQIPFSMLWVVGMEGVTLPAHWEGQFVATVNPVSSVLGISIFQFEPKFSAEGIKCLEQARLTKELGQDITRNMEQFEVSRQLRYDIGLKDITQIYLYAPYGEDNEGMLVLQMSEMPQFYQRWLHTSAENLNKWQKRGNFFSKVVSMAPVCVYLGGLVSELNEVLALMLACEEKLQVLYHRGTEIPFTTQLLEPFLQTSHNKNPEEKNHLIEKQQLCPGLTVDIIGVLVQHCLMSAEQANSLVLAINEQQHNPAGSRRHSTESKLIEEGLPTELPVCLRDYIIHKCPSAETLRSMLSRPLNARLSGFTESDFHAEQCVGLDIDAMTVGELTSRQASDVMYYSFCKQELGQQHHDQHCARCHTCTTWRYWHCDACDKCTTGKVCENCGTIKENPGQRVIKPLSVFKNESQANCLLLNDTRPDWQESLQLGDTDILQWSSPVAQTALDQGPVPVYNASNAMVDQLGLLNPVGFLLGQPTAGASRKHRRKKRSLDPVCSTEDLYGKASQSEPGCVLQ